jgi:ABC-type Fe3+-siderophore transport system, permease component
MPTEGQLVGVDTIQQEPTSAKPKKYAAKLIKALKALRGLPVGIILLALLVVLFFLSFTLGRYPLSVDEVANILFSHIFNTNYPVSATDITVVMQIRLPRILAAILIGSSLSLAGGSFQGLFRNPLVSPDILGVASGAGFGAALAILLSGDPVTVEIMAFCFGLAAVGLACLISSIVKGNRTLSLILAGIAIASLTNALLALSKYVADPSNQLPAITYWLMGSLASIKLEDLYIAAIPMITGIVILLLMRWRFNVLSMGDEEAQAMGVNTNRIRLIIVVCCTMMTAAAVCISGIIGWIGLVIPHIGRILVGPDHKRLLPVTLLLGATYLLLIDNIARTVTMAEIPIGILTALIGAPVFIYMLNRQGKGWK